MTNKEARERVAHEICLCCVHKPLKIYEGLFRDSPETQEGTGCYRGFEKNKYCELAIKATNQIMGILNLIDPDKLKVIGEGDKILLRLEVKDVLGIFHSETEVQRVMQYVESKIQAQLDYDVRQLIEQIE